MRKYLIIFIILLALGAIYLLKVQPMLNVASGYAAKMMCTNHFENNRDLDNINKTELTFLPLPISSKLLSNGVSASVYGLSKQTAYYKKGIGCVLVHGKDDFNVTYDKKTPSHMGFELDKVEIPENVDQAKLNEALNYLFDEGNEITNKKTKAVAVAYKGKLIGEQYAVNNNKDTKQLGWSMTKSIISTMVGMRVKEGKMDIKSRNLVPEWQNDERKDISLNNLLQMSSGLEWEEEYGKASDATIMLYESENVYEKAIQAPFLHQPGTHWMYSSGTTNILSGLLKKTFSSNKAYYDYLYNGLFDKIGMHSALVETDESGTIVGSSYCYATTRDWLKFGLLYLNDGKVNGEEIITKDWIKYVTTPVEDSQGQYGGQIWLNANKEYKNCSDKMYYFRGFQGQRIYVIPEKELIIARFGINDDVDFDGLIGKVMNAIKE